MTRTLVHVCTIVWASGQATGSINMPSGQANWSPNQMAGAGSLPSILTWPPQSCLAERISWPAQGLARGLAQQGSHANKIVGRALALANKLLDERFFHTVSPLCQAHTCTSREQAVLVGVHSSHDWSKPGRLSD